VSSLILLEKEENATTSYGATKGLDLSRDCNGDKDKRTTEKKNGGTIKRRRRKKSVSKYEGKSIPLLEKGPGSQCSKKEEGKGSNRVPLAPIRKEEQKEKRKNLRVSQTEKKTSSLSFGKKRGKEGGRTTKSMVGGGGGFGVVGGGGCCCCCDARKEEMTGHGTRKKRGRRVKKSVAAHGERKAEEGQEKKRRGT